MQQTEHVVDEAYLFMNGRCYVIAAKSVYVFYRLCTSLTPYVSLAVAGSLRTYLTHQQINQLSKQCRNGPEKLL